MSSGGRESQEEQGGSHCNGDNELRESVSTIVHLTTFEKCFIMTRLPLRSILIHIHI